MFGQGFGKGGRRGGVGHGAGAYGPGYGRATWGTEIKPWSEEMPLWGGPPAWARRWGIGLPAAERKTWLEQVKAHLQQRLEEIEQELKALDKTTE